MENSLPGCSVPGCAGKTWPGAKPDDSLMPPLRRAAFLPALDPLEPSFPLPRAAALVALFPVLPIFAASAAHAAMAIEYASSPVEQPALHMRSVAGLSGDLRASSCGKTCRVSAFIAPGWRKNPVSVLSTP